MTTALCKDNVYKLSRDRNDIMLLYCVRTSGDEVQYRCLPATAIISAHIGAQCNTYVYCLLLTRHNVVQSKTERSEKNYT